VTFPEYYQAQEAASPRAKQVQMACTAPLTYKGKAQLETDLDNLKNALKGVNAGDVFVPCISPANIEDWNENKYYKSDEEYLFAIADAMNVEYKAITDAGFLVQVDDPRLVSYYLINPRVSIDEVRKWAELRVEALNHALRNIPEDRIRYHLCWGSWHGPHAFDIEMAHMVDIMLRVKAQAYLFEAGNVRHEHEWSVWRDTKLPDDRLILPGVVSHATNVVEHPELVAERIGRCGFQGARMSSPDRLRLATFAGSDEVHASIVWRLKRPGARRSRASNCGALTGIDAVTAHAARIDMPRRKEDAGMPDRDADKRVAQGCASRARDEGSAMKQHPEVPR
jgi:5-methyltetrahydropteroyltriglutamate--homocysteine methyltransferase